MTCIVGVVDKGRIHIGGDSAAVWEGSFRAAVRADRKVFVNGDFVMGFTSSFRMGQLLAFGFTPPKPREGTDVFAYMVTDFIDAVRQRMKDGGYARVKDGHSEEGGTFLVGYAGRLFMIESDFQVAEAIHGYDAVGCGAHIALGSLYSTRNLTDPEARLRESLAAAEIFSAGVRGPFHFVATTIPAGSRKRKA